jgi:hypothetical protein
MNATTEMPCGGVSGADGKLVSPAISPPELELQSLSDELACTRSELEQTRTRVYGLLDGVRAAFAAQDAVIRVLAGTRTLEAAAEPLLEALCASLDFELGLLWGPDPSDGTLRVIAHWQFADADETLLATAQAQRLEPGRGVAGRVFSQAMPLVCDDAELVAQGPLAVAMATRGLRTVCAFPVEGTHDILAVVELIRQAPLGPEHAIEPAVRAIGDRIATFIERERLEERYLALFTLLESRIQEREVPVAEPLPGKPAEEAGAKVIQLRRIERAASGTGALARAAVPS